MLANTLFFVLANDCFCVLANGVFFGDGQQFCHFLVLVGVRNKALANSELLALANGGFLALANGLLQAVGQRRFFGVGQRVAAGRWPTPVFLALANAVGGPLVNAGFLA